MVKGVSAASGRLIRMSHLCRKQTLCRSERLSFGQKIQFLSMAHFLCIVAEAVNAYRDRSSWAEYGSEGKIQ